MCYNQVKRSIEFLNISMKMFGTAADKLDYGFIWYLLTPICLLIIWCCLRTVHAAALAQFRGVNDYIDRNDREKRRKKRQEEADKKNKIKNGSNNSIFIVDVDGVGRGSRSK